MISDKTEAAAFNRLAGSLSTAINDVVRARPIKITDFILLSLFYSNVSVTPSVLMHGWHQSRSPGGDQCHACAGKGVAVEDWQLRITVALAED
jgi:hypothetical protein